MNQLKQAKKLKAAGKSVREIADTLNVSKSTISRWLKPQQQKSMSNPTWHTILGGETNGWADIFGTLPVPDPHQLVSLFTDTVYTCASWLANSVCSQPLHLYVKTAKHQEQPKCITAGISYQVRKALLKNPVVHTKALDADVKEVAEHPLLELLEHPAEGYTLSDLLRHIDLQLSLLGNAWVHVHKDRFGLPDALVPLFGQHITPKVDNGEFLGWDYNITNPPKFYPKECVIHFKLDDVDGDGLGEGPVKALYERILLGRNELAYLNTLYKNQARPTGVIAIKDGVSAEQQERLMKETQMRFTQGGQGGIVAIDADSFQFEPLSWAPKDMLGVELYKWTKLQIVNGFGLQIALFDSDSSNRAIADTARYLASQNAVLPRLRLIEEKLNYCLVPLYDDRLMLAFDSPVKEDETEEIAKITAYVDKKILTINEARKMIGLPPVSWGDAPPEQPQQPQENQPATLI
jgi:HK97 family phage portal protein